MEKINEEWKKWLTELIRAGGGSEFSDKAFLKKKSDKQKAP